MLFEALPGVVRALAAHGERLGLSSARSVEHLRTWETLGRVEAGAGGTFEKRPEERPYF